MPLISLFQRLPAYQSLTSLTMERLRVQLRCIEPWLQQLYPGNSNHADASRLSFLIKHSFRGPVTSTARFLRVDVSNALLSRTSMLSLLSA